MTKAEQSSESNTGRFHFLTKYFKFLGEPYILFTFPFVLLILVIFVIGVLLAVFSDPEDVAFRIELVRDVFIIIMALECILIFVAVAVLGLQVTRLIAMLRNETTPIMENTRETVETAKGTARFVSKNLVGPIMGLQAIMAAFLTFVREIGGIRRAIRHQPEKELEDQVEDE